MEIKCAFLPQTEEIEIAGKFFKLSSFNKVAFIKIVNHSFDFFSDPTGEKYTIGYDTEIDLTKWVSTLKEALDIINADETSKHLVENFVSYLVPLKQLEDIKNLSFSVRNLPGVIFKNNELVPYLIGETLVHEADHQLFYAIEKFEKFWDTDVRTQEAIYFSPWRDDPRPLDGILRGLSSFARVSKYYSTILSVIPFSTTQIDAVGIMLLTRLRQSQAALEIVINANDLSAFGIKYANEIKQTRQDVDDEVNRYKQYERWNDNAISAIENHKNNWKILNAQNG